jgi:excisionase family DNA binding protein
MQCSACDMIVPDGSIFCSKCGTRFEIIKEENPVVPMAMTVEEASKIFFNGTVSKELIYKEIRAGKLPHVKMGKNHLLLDRNELTAWWQEQIEKSKQKQKPFGLRKIN